MRFLTAIALAASFGASADVRKGLTTLDFIAGINGGGCAYTSVAAAVEDAVSGDTIYIESGLHEGLIGEIDVDLTIVPGRPGPPGATGCERENAGADPFDTRLSGAGGSDDAVGGLVHVLDGAEVLIRNLSLESANANNGGILAVTGGATVTLSGVRVHDGEATASGGLIYVEGGAEESRLNLGGNSQLTAGRVSPGDGGGIALFGASLTVQHAGIGSLLLGITPPAPNNTSDGNGGGIYASGSTLSFRGNVDMLANTAGGNGGGLFALDSTITAAGVNFNSNQASVSGGGSSLLGGVASFGDTTFVNNQATTSGSNQGGGGIHVADNASLQLDAVTLDSNDSGLLGGALLTVDSEVTVTDSMFDGNQANSGGAILSASSNITIEAGSLTNNDAFLDGGAILNTAGGTLTVTGGALLDMNSAQNGGAIAQGQTGSSNIVLDGVTLSNNQVTFVSIGGGRGGALYSGAGSIVIRNALFDGNRADRFGGAVFVEDFFDNGLTVEIADSEFVSNEADQGDMEEGGGALAANDVESLSIRDTQFHLNTAGLSGGALRLEGVQSSAMTNVRFTNNQSALGGAIFSRDSNFQIGTQFSTCDPFALAANDYCALFAMNSASQSGGAIFVDDIFTAGVVSLNQVALLENTAGSSSATAGAALAGQSTVPGVFMLENVLVANNGSPGNEASAIVITTDHELSMRHVTIAGNEARPLWVDGFGSNVEIHDSVIYLNGMGPRVSNEVSFIRSCNNAQTPDADGQSMGGNLGNPNFTTTARGEYRLSAVSVSADQCVVTSPSDLDGLFRLGPDLADQGAFERDGAVMRPDPLFSDGFELP